MILDDLDGACRAAMTTVRRSIGQYARHAHDEIRKNVRAAEERLDRAMEQPPPKFNSLHRYLIQRCAGEKW